MWTLPAAQLQCSDGEQKDAEQRALLREQRAVEMRELHGAGQVGSGGGGGVLVVLIPVCVCVCALAREHTCALRREV